MKQENEIALYPFQSEGVNFIESKGGRALIADEMGIGKTIQALGWIKLHPELRPVIIVVPASLKIQWQREIRKWIPEASIEIISKSTPHPVIQDIIIINYDILHPWIDALIAIRPQVMILDECHYIKSVMAKRTTAVTRIAKNIKHVIALSGTPITNRPIELYNVLELLNEDLFPSKYKFAYRFCNPEGKEFGKFGWDFSGSSNTDELNKILTDKIMIRRKKADVLQDLPQKTYSFVPVELSNRKEYDKAKNSFVKWTSQNDPHELVKKQYFQSLAKIEELKQLAVKGKMKQIILWIRDFLETGEKLVLFAIHKDIVNQIVEEFGEACVKIDGSCSMIARQNSVDKFQTDPSVKLFIGNIQAAGVGITLTASSNVAFLELPWTPSAISQAEDRCHRIGQKNAVNVYYLLAEDTIEERIAKIIDSKKKIVSQIVDGTDDISESLLLDLIKNYK